jgi:hypothetical protein
MIIHVIQSQLLPHPLLALTQRADPSSDCRHMLTHRQGDALNEGRVDLPAAGREHLLDGLQGPEHHAVVHAHQAPPAHGLDPLGIQQLRQRHPARLGGWPCGLAAGRLHPVPLVGQQRRHVLAKAIGEKQWGAVGGQALRDLVDHTLGHHQGAMPDVDRQQQLTLRIHRDPDPLGRPLQALNGLSLTDLPVLDGAEEGKQLIELDLPDTHVVQDVLGEGPELLRSLDEPLQYGSGINLDHPRGPTDAQAFSQACDDTYDELDSGTLAMKERAEGLEKIVATGDAQQLPPTATMGMAIGAKIPLAHPAAIGTVWVRTAMVPGVHLALAATGGGDPWRWRSRGSDQGGRRCLFTRDTMGLLGETGKRFWLAGAWAAWEDGLR